jgi:hypothetical protein
VSQDDYLSGRVLLDRPRAAAPEAAGTGTV